MKSRNSVGGVGGDLDGYGDWWRRILIIVKVMVEGSDNSHSSLPNLISFSTE